MHLHGVGTRLKSTVGRQRRQNTRCELKLGRKGKVNSSISAFVEAPNNPNGQIYKSPTTAIWAFCELLTQRLPPECTSEYTSECVAIERLARADFLTAAATDISAPTGTKQYSTGEPTIAVHAARGQFRVEHAASCGQRSTTVCCAPLWLLKGAPS